MGFRGGFRGGSAKFGGILDPAGQWAATRLYTILAYETPYQHSCWGIKSGPNRPPASPQIVAQGLPGGRRGGSRDIPRLPEAPLKMVQNWTRAILEIIAPACTGVYFGRRPYLGLAHACQMHVPTSQNTDKN